MGDEYVAEDGNESISWWRRPLRAARAWLERPTASNRDSLVTGALGALLLTAAGAAAGAALAVVRVIDLGGEVPVWLGAILFALGLGLGTLAGIHWARHPVESDAEHVRQQRRADAGLALEELREKLKKGELDDALVTLEHADLLWVESCCLEALDSLSSLHGQIVDLLEQIESGRS